MNRGGLLPDREFSYLPETTTNADLSAIAQRAFETELALFAPYAFTGEPIVHLLGRSRAMTCTVGGHNLGSNSQVVTCGCGAVICSSCWRLQGRSMAKYQELRNSIAAWLCSACTKQWSPLPPEPDDAPEPVHLDKPLVPDLLQYMGNVKAEVARRLQVFKSGLPADAPLSSTYRHLLWCNTDPLTEQERRQRLANVKLPAKAVPHYLAKLLPKVKESRDRLTRVKKGERFESDLGGDEDYLYRCCNTTQGGKSLECSLCFRWAHLSCESVTRAPPGAYTCSSCRAKRLLPDRPASGKRQNTALDSQPEPTVAVAPELPPIRVASARQRRLPARLL